MQISTDSDGFLTDWRQWDHDIARHIAASQNIELTEDHWIVINQVREFYQQFHTTPPIRVLVKTLAQRQDPDQFSSPSLYLQQLFPPSAAKQIARIAGLPKPAKCI